METAEIRLRESPRVMVEAEARLLLLPSGPELDARVLDLSATGMGLGVPVTATVGQSCSFEITLDEARVEGRGVVVWARGRRADREDAPNVGVRFLPDPHGTARIAEWVDRRLARRRRLPMPAEAPGVAAGAGSAALSTAIASGAAAVPDALPVPAGDSSPVITAGSGKKEGRSRWATAVALGVAGALLVTALAVYRIARAGRDTRSPAPGGAASLVVSVQGSSPASKAGAPAVAPPSAAGDEPSTPGGPQPSDRSSATVQLAAPAHPVADRGAPASAVRPGRVLAIVPQSSGGETMVAIRGDAPWRQRDVFATLIGPDPPRYLLRLSGIERPFRPSVLEVGAPLLDRVRTGLHDTPRGRELHVVLDLPTRALDSTWEIDGEVLRVRLRSPAP